jgi:hypothetical protein
MPSLQKLATLLATSTRETFLAELGGEAVLIRLDERGGKDEPAPWAFHSPPSAVGPPAGQSLPPREDESVDVESLRGALENTQKMKKPDVTSEVFRAVSADDETKTQALPAPALPVPPARGAASVHVVKLKDGKARVGRTAGVEIEIREMSLSRRHASLSSHPRDRGAMFIRDMGSQNGTRVNGKALEKDEDRKLRSGDVVAFGDVECLFLEAGELATHLPRLTD